MNKSLMRIAVSAVAVAAGASIASADLSPVVFRIEASNSNGAGAWQVALDLGNFGPDGTYRYNLPDAINIRSGAGEEIAALTDVQLTYVEDPQVNVNFVVQAAALDVNVTVSSALLSFPGIDPAVGRASAGVSLTDNNGDGASLSAMSGSLYEAVYNGMVPGGTNFASLISSPVTAGSFDTTVVSESNPAGPGFDPIVGPVSSMSSRFSFTLSANDSAAGTSAWVVIPSPGAAGLLGLAGVFGVIRRRR